MRWLNPFRARSTPAAYVSQGRLPQHVAIIMDGNGRWAQQKHMPRTKGHFEGAEALRRTLRACAEAGIRYLTVYAFSSENWKRPAQEVDELMGLLKLYLSREVEDLHRNGVRLRFIGDRSRLGESIRTELERVEAYTQRNTVIDLVIAISYGARQEMTQAAQMLAERVQRGELAAEAITEAHMAEALHTNPLPDPDLLIRTGGEHRLSNFLLWQAAYAELYFTPVLWPDFSAEDLHAALADYARRERRFGTTEAAA